MKKLFGMLIILFIIYFGIQILFNALGKGDETKYILETSDYSFNIYEKSTFRLKNSEDNYYFKIEVDDTVFTFQLFHDFNKKHEVINEIHYFKNSEYKCILPIFDNEILMDALCLNNGIYNYAYNLNNQEINNFTRNITNYDITNYQDNLNYYETNTFKVNQNALYDNIYVAISTYKGVLTISREFNQMLHDMNVFDKDIYDHKISAFANNYYLVADYNSNYSFNQFYVLNLVTLNKSTFNSNVKISFDSYIQGVVDDLVYLYDKDNNKQYEINPKEKSIVEIGTSNEIKYYNNGWTTISVSEAKSEKKFINNYQEDGYVKVDKIGDEVGFYYLYQKNGNQYNVYRRNIQDSNVTYLFTTDNINNVVYIDNNIYYINGDKIMTYSDFNGIKTVLQYSELQFNKNIKIQVYEDK